VIAATPPPPPVAFAQSFAVVGPRTAPRRALLGGRIAPPRAFVGGRPVRIRLRLRAVPEPVDLQVRIERAGRLVHVLRLRAGVQPHRVVELRWRGRTKHGSVARAGRYRVRAGPVGGRLRPIGGFVLRGHVYPVRGPHGFRGAIGTFAAPRSGGRSHEGFDVNARCGTTVVAARAGIVVRLRYDPVLNGNFVIIKAPAQRLAYWYVHLRSPARVRLGQRVRTGQRLGEVGATGNAITIGCHLHFELHGPGGPFDPLPRLRAWDAWS
jgi:murein DD-endopeptidase MepM/ murein hydrolase activator NlpD